MATPASPRSEAFELRALVGPILEAGWFELLAQHGTFGTVGFQPLDGAPGTGLAARHVFVPSFSIRARSSLGGGAGILDWRRLSSIRIPIYSRAGMGRTDSVPLVHIPPRLAMASCMP
jgi:hypothetical protein